MNYDAILAALLKQESGNQDYNPDGSLVTSSAGAQGAMQVMPATNSDPGFGVAPAKDDSPEERDRVGRDYLSAMMGRYKDPSLALAAYNAGPGKVDAAIQKNGPDPQAVLAAMPEETQKYVPKILDNAKSQDMASNDSGNVLDEAGYGGSQNAPQIRPLPDESANLLDHEGYEKPKGLWDTIKDMGSSFASGDLQGLTLGAGDELTAGTSGDYDKNIGPIRAEMNQQYNDHPIAYDAGIGLGGLANFLTLGKLGGLVAPEAATGLKALSEAHPYLASAGIGAGTGGVSGFASGEGDAEKRSESAVSSGALGAILGPLAHAGMAHILEPLLSSGSSALSSLASKLGLGEEAETAKYSDGAVKKVSDRLGKDFSDPQDMAGMIKNYLANKTGLAEEAGKNTQNLAKGAAQFPSGEVPTENYLENRAAETPQNLKQAASVISPNNDFYGTLDDITKEGQQKAAPLYDKAFNSGPVNSDRIQQFLQQPELKTGLSRGLKIQRLESIADGKPFNPNDYGVTGFNEAGDPTLGPVPNMRLLDAGKRGLDSMITDETLPTGKLTETGRALVKFKQSYVNELKATNPDYGQALDSASDYLSNQKAMNTGRDYTSMDADTVSKTYNNLNPVQQKSFKSGMVRDIMDTINKNPEKPQLYKSVFGSEGSEQRTRLQNVLNPDEFQSLSDQVKAQEDFYNYRKNFGGSPTMGKAKAAEPFDNQMFELAHSAATDGPIKTGMNAVIKYAKQKISGLGDAQAGQVAQMLHETDPVEKVKILKQLANSGGKSQEAMRLFFNMDTALKQGRINYAHTGALGGAMGADITQ